MTNTDLTLAQVKAYGRIGFHPTGDDSFRVAVEASELIIKLDEEKNDLLSFMMSPLENPEYATTVVSIDEGTGMFSDYRQLIKTTTYAKVGTSQRPNKVIYGPIVSKEKAQAIVDILNS